MRLGVKSNSYIRRYVPLFIFYFIFFHRVINMCELSYYMLGSGFWSSFVVVDPDETVNNRYACYSSLRFPCRQYENLVAQNRCAGVLPTYFMFYFIVFYRFCRHVWKFSYIEREESCSGGRRFLPLVYWSDIDDGYVHFTLPIYFKSILLYSEK